MAVKIQRNSLLETYGFVGILAIFLFSGQKLFKVISVFSIADTEKNFLEMVD